MAAQYLGGIAMPQEVLSSLMQEGFAFELVNRKGFRRKRAHFKIYSSGKDVAVDKRNTVCVINLTPYDACLERACVASAASGGCKCLGFQHHRSLFWGPQLSTKLKASSAMGFPKASEDDQLQCEPGDGGSDVRSKIDGPAATRGLVSSWYVSSWVCGLL